MPSWRLSAIGPSRTDVALKVRPALLPVPAHDAGAWQSRGPVSGSPGILPIPAPAPFPTAEMDATSLAQTGWIGLPSGDFSYWRPSIYIQYPVSRFHGSVFSDNQMPVPAIDPRGVPAVVMAGVLHLGQFQVRQPRRAVRYPSMRGKRDWKSNP